MNIQYLSKLLSRWDDVTVIGRKYESEGIIANIIGLVQVGGVCKILILLYDEEYQKEFETESEQVTNSPPKVMESNRLMLREIIKSNPCIPFLTADKVYFGEKEINIRHIEISRFDQNYFENVLLICGFLNHGWQPDGMELHNLDMLSLVSVELESSDLHIQENQMIRFNILPRNTGHLVEKPLILNIGTDYQNKLMFTDNVTGQEHWAQINKVYLMDMWENLYSIYNNPKLLEQMTPQQIEQTKTAAEKRLLDICPKGMYFPVVEYECEEDIFLDFYSRDYLDSKPLIGSGSMSFFIKPEQTVGRLGVRLKSVVIPEPYPSDITCIEAELFQYHHMLSGRDIVLD